MIRCARITEDGGVRDRIARERGPMRRGLTELAGERSCRVSDQPGADVYLLDELRRSCAVLQEEFSRRDTVHSLCYPMLRGREAPFAAVYPYKALAVGSSALHARTFARSPSLGAARAEDTSGWTSPPDHYTESAATTRTPPRTHSDADHRLCSAR